MKSTYKREPEREDTEELRERYIEYIGIVENLSEPNKQMLIDFALALKSGHTSKDHPSLTRRTPDTTV